MFQLIIAIFGSKSCLYIFVAMATTFNIKKLVMHEMQMFEVFTIATKKLIINTAWLYPTKHNNHKQ